MWVIHDGEGKIWGVVGDFQTVKDCLQITYGAIGGVQVVADNRSEVHFENRQTNKNIFATHVKYYNFAEHL